MNDSPLELRLPRLWKLCLGVVLALYTVQPWSFAIYNIPVQVLGVWLLFAWVLLFRVQYVFLVFSCYSSVQWLLIAVFVFAVYFRIVNDSDSWLRLQQLGTGIVLSLLSATIITNIYGRTVTIIFLGITASISSIVALLQYLGLASWSWRGTMYYMKSVKIPSGLEVYQVSFSYSVIGIAVVLLVLGLYQIKNREEIKNIPKWLSVLSSSVILLGVLATVSRSGILGIVMGVLMAAIGIKYIGRKFIPGIVIVLLALIVGVSAMFDQTKLFTAFNAKTESAANDMRLLDSWYYFTPVLLQYPFGVPASIKKSGLEERVKANGSPELKKAFRISEGYDPHNWVLTTGLFYGISAASALIVFFIVMIFKAIKAIRIYRYLGNIEFTVLTIAMLAANFGLLTHAWFHNSNPIMGDMRWWFWIGAMAGFSALAQRMSDIRTGRTSGGGARF